MRRCCLLFVLGACRFGFDARTTDEGEAGVPGFDGSTTLPPSDATVAAPGVVYAHSSDELFRIDPSTRVVTRIGNFTGPCAVGQEDMTDIAIDQSGALIGVTFDFLYRIDAATAACEQLASLPRQFNGLSFVPSGETDILIGTTVQGEVWQIEPSTGNTTRLSRYGNGVSSAGDLVAVRNVGTFSAVRRMSDATDYLARVDVNTGTATIIGNTGFVDVFGLGYWKGSFYGFTNGRQFVLIDITTGAGSLVEVGSVMWWGAGVTTNAE